MDTEDTPELLRVHFSTGSVSYVEVEQYFKHFGPLVQFTPVSNGDSTTVEIRFRYPISFEHASQKGFVQIGCAKVKVSLKDKEIEPVMSENGVIDGNKLVFDEYMNIIKRCEIIYGTQNAESDNDSDEEIPPIYLDKTMLAAVDAVHEQSGYEFGQLIL